MMKVPIGVGLAVLLVACSATDERASNDVRPSPTTLEVVDDEVASDDGAAFDDVTGSDNEVASSDEVPAEAATAEPGWDEQVRANFMEACLTTSSGASGYCTCTLERFEEYYAQPEFERLEQRLIADHPLPQEASQIIEACVADHRDEVATDREAAWSQRSQTEFLNACIDSSGGATEYCGCALTGMMERFTEDGFVEVSLAVEAGEPEPEAFTATVENCAAEHP